MQFVRYCKNTLKINKTASILTDHRKWAFIPTQVFFWSLFFMYSLRVRSILNLERKLGTQSWKSIIKIIGNRSQPAKKDDIRNVIKKISTKMLRQGLVKVNKRFKRMKVWAEKPNGIQTISIDGLELFTTNKRSCEKCCTRKVKRKNHRGETTTHTQYYHKVVIAQVIASPVKSILDFEMIAPGEGEITAARRLFRRLVSSYGRPFFDAVVGDALYLNGPFINLARKYRIHVIVRMKRDDMLLYKDAKGLFDHPSQRTRPHSQGSSIERRMVVKYSIWEAAGLTSLESVNVPLRVLKVIEETRPKKAKTFQNRKEIWIATTIPSSTLGANAIRQLMHKRWEIENNANRELKNGWFLNHCLVHHPAAIENAVLIATMAFNAFHCFVKRRIRPISYSFRASLCALAEELSSALDQLRKSIHYLLEWDSG